jgi:TatD DNase family protein
MKCNYFDIHSHLNLEPLSRGVENQIQKLKDTKVGTIVVGVDYDTSLLAVKLAKENISFLYATVGQHPNDNREEEFDYEKYLELAKENTVVGIGECGLDFFRLPKDLDYNLEIARQVKLFKKHISLAKDLSKPLMIHARPTMGTMDAYEKAITILEDEDFTGHANFHFFVGNIEIAQKIVAKNWSMSFDGPITFSNDYDNVIKFIPVQNIMCETDAPFAAPMPHRGRTCEPWMVEEIYKKIAEIKNVDKKEFKNQIFENIRRIWGIEC